MQEIFNESIRNCYPDLVDEYFMFSRLEGVAQEKYGDYVRYVIDFLW